MNNKTVLVLADGTFFLGNSFGTLAPSHVEISGGLRRTNNRDKSLPVGEILFNTSMTGYTEIISDPSFSGQIVCMTYPHIGNYGVDLNCLESGLGNAQTGAMIRGFIVHTLYEGPVPDSRISLHTWLKNENVSGISNVDTRALTIHIRDRGEQNATIMSINSDEENLHIIIQEIAQQLRAVPSMEGKDMASELGQKHSYVYTSSHITLQNNTSVLPQKSSIYQNKKQIQSFENLKIGVYDCGSKHSIVKLLAKRQCKITLIAQNTPAEEIKKQQYDMIMVSNGPGDPAVLDKQIDCIKDLIGHVVLCGICLGNQLLALALGAKTYKMMFGHHGANHPVKDLTTHKLFITSQNHGFAVNPDTLPQGSKLWFVNTNDKSVEGFMNESKKIYSVQFHPEAAPGPTDTQWLFDTFLEKTLQSTK